VDGWGGWMGWMDEYEWVSGGVDAVQVCGVVQARRGAAWYGGAA
jgi:hypothetical protein